MARATFLAAGSLLGGLLLLLASAPPVSAADLAVDGVVVQPASPAPATLCQLRVKLKNGGSQSVSMFKFGVKVDGQENAQYKVTSYAVDLAPGTVGEVALYNFYSPTAPKTFEVQVSVLEAQWVEVKREGANTTTTPLGPVVGLPISGSLSVKMSAAK
jgi:hypothetical protein